MKFQLVKAAVPLSGAVLFAGISGYLLYLLYKKEDDDDVAIDAETDILKVLVKEKIKIPKETTGMIIGRQGSNVQVIQRETCTNINFSNNDDTEKFCIIRGQQENVKKAKELILQFIKDAPNHTEIKVMVPQSSVGRIIGKNGSTILNICNSTGAKVFIERQEETFEAVSNNTRSVTIKGSKEEVESAKRAVMEKVREESGYRNVANKGAPIKSSSVRSPLTEHLPAKENRRNPNNPEAEMLSKPSPDLHTLAKKVEVDVSSKQMVFPFSSEFKPVYVTAVASATLFWVQVLYPRISMLKNLVDSMTKYYSEKKNKITISSDQLVIGKMVAAHFPGDLMIYRGRIAERQHGDDPNKLVIFFVDYGDVELIDPNMVYELKSDFLKLNFQAIECCLHGVEEIKQVEKKATETFEELSHSARFIPIKAKLSGFKLNHGMKLPSLDLMTKFKGKEISIAKELIKLHLLKEEKLDGETNNQLPDDVILEHE